MQKLITDYLEDAVLECPDKVAFVDYDNFITYAQVGVDSLNIAEMIGDT